MSLTITTFALLEKFGKDPKGENGHCLEASRARLLRRTIYRTEDAPALLWMLLLEVVRGRQGEEGVRVLVQPWVVCVMRVEVEWQLNLRIEMGKARNSGRHKLTDVVCAISLLFSFLLPFHASVLEPNLNLSIS